MTPDERVTQLEQRLTQLEAKVDALAAALNLANRVAQLEAHQQPLGWTPPQPRHTTCAICNLPISQCRGHMMCEIPYLAPVTDMVLTH